MFTGTRPCTCKRRHRDRHLCDASSTNVSDTQVKSVRATHREVSWFDPRDDQECVDHKLHLHRVFDQDAAACCDEHSRRIKSTSTVSLECNQSTRRVLESLPLSRLPSASLSLSLSTQRLVLLLQLLFFFPLLLLLLPLPFTFTPPQVSCFSISQKSTSTAWVPLAPTLATRVS